MNILKKLGLAAILTAGVALSGAAFAAGNRYYYGLQARAPRGRSPGLSH